MKPLLSQMLRPETPAAGSVWLERGTDMDFRQFEYIVHEANKRGVEYALRHYGCVRQPAYSAIGLREFHLRFKPAP